ncbi:MAG: hypothetical protein QOJ61_3765, partial [Mycobacterium sp.]|nr:hypothetical protein [Mycobacterium sp.]
AMKKLAAKKPRCGRGGGDARAHDHEGHDEGDERLVERFLRVQRGPCGLRRFGDQLQIAECGDRGDQEGQ